MPLTLQTLRALPEAVAIPTYDRAALAPAVVHMSVGSFHRSHQAMYFDEIAQRGISTDWGIVGVGLRRRGMREVLAAQDGLYTVLIRGAGPDLARVVGVIGRYQYAPESGEAVLATLADPRTRLVTLTVTGCAYKADPATGVFAAGDPEVVADLADPRRPSSAIGYLVEALDRRRRAGHPPFTVLSCDNIPGNGPLARRALVGFAELRDPRLARWIDAEGAFPSSMVDRITPKTMASDVERLARDFGIRDRWPVITEAYTQWVIEDQFCNGRPPLDQVGAQFVTDVRPYAMMKTRLLNASHCALGYLGSLAGHRRLDEAMGDPLLHDYIARLMDHEITPLLPPLPGVDLDDYKSTLRERFANPKIADQLARLCRAGSAKMPTHVLSSINESREAGRPHELLTLAVAAWFRYLRGVDEQGRELDLDDPRGDRLRTLAILGGTDPRPLLAERALFGDLGDDPAFVGALGDALELIERRGARGALAVTIAADASGRYTRA
ncbi:MAG TPA: mannitol dehydrogenase family protein [Solirubrobacteraceae bacterium]